MEMNCKVKQLATNRPLIGTERQPRALKQGHLSELIKGKASQFAYRASIRCAAFRAISRRCI